MRKQLKSILEIFLFTCLALGCVRSRPNHPVIVLAVHSLASDSFVCDTEASIRSGFFRFCQESVRFTHAYTSSTMAVAALSSVLTGLYPRESTVRDNGSHSLPIRIKTVAEKAAYQGWNTGFFTGGPPVFSKSGLGQGFLYQFEEIPTEGQQLYTTAKDLIAHFLNWQRRVDDNRPFFAVLYFPDLQFVDTPTRTELDEIRPNSYQSQLQAVDEALGMLVNQLELRGLWESSYVFLLGLNGQTASWRQGELAGTNLFSDNTQIVLMVKPPKKTKDVQKNRTVDEYVSLVDVGVTIDELLMNDKNLRPSSQKLPRYSLLQSIQESGAFPEFKSKPLLIESNWAPWHKSGSSRWALRMGSLMYLHQAPSLVVDSRLDRMELNSLTSGDPRNWQSLFELAQALELPIWTGLTKSMAEKVKVGADIFKSTAPEAESASRLRGLLGKRPWDQQVIGWLASIYLRQKNWMELEKLGQKYKEEWWMYLARVNMNKSASPPGDGCFKLMAQVQLLAQANVRPCDDELFVVWLRWVSARKNRLDDTNAADNFIREYLYSQLDQRLSEYNYVTHLNWDLDEAKPTGPNKLDLAFAIPEYSVYPRLISQRLAHQKRD